MLAREIMFNSSFGRYYCSYYFLWQPMYTNAEPKLKFIYKQSLYYFR